MPLVAGLVAPHGGIVLEELCSPEEQPLAAKTRAAMVELGERLAQLRPRTLVVLTPHNVHVEGHLCVITARRLEGELDEGDGRRVQLQCRGDRDLALNVGHAIAAAGVPVIGVSYGGNDPDFSDGQVMPMDWGTLIPAWFLGGRWEPPVDLVVISPSRDISPRDHVAAGRALGEAARMSDAPVAVVASADHGHAHSQTGPYGFDPAAREYDELIVRLLSSGDLGELEYLDPELVERAKADSWWQLLMLYGALPAGTPVQLLSYEAPTYFGMACAWAQPA